MKVVLTKDVRDMGKKGSVLEVSDGHAINFLIPRKMAIPATATAVKQAELHQKQTDDRKAVDTDLLKKNIATLTEKRLTLIMKANEQGHLYEAVNAADIVSAAKDQQSVDLPEEAVHLEKPIKEVGEHTVTVSSGDVSGTFMLTVEAEA